MPLPFTVSTELYQSALLCFSRTQQPWELFAKLKAGKFTLRAEVKPRVSTTSEQWTCARRDGRAHTRCLSLCLSKRQQQSVVLCPPTFLSCVTLCLLLQSVGQYFGQKPPPLYLRVGDVAPEAEL